MKTHMFLLGNTTYVENIKKEYSILKKLDYKDALLQNDINIPYEAKCALKYFNQAMFNPKKYVISLANIIKYNIFENSNVTSIKRKNGKYIINTESYTVTCNKVIIATHFPIKDIPGLYFLKMYQNTSYVIEVDIGNNIFDGMYITVENPTLSFRSYKYNNKNILLVGGNNIKTGDIVNSNMYSYLENVVKKMYPNCTVLRRWNTQDCITLDKIPYIGKYSIFLPNMYVATGFNKWGMTTSNIAAEIITDKILHKENKYEEIFKSTRLHPLTNCKELYYNLKQVIQSFFINKIKIKEDSIANIPNNTGKIIKENNKKIGIYKDIEGNIYKINPYCSHLKCLLTFNSQDKTWDCPCHGSRFDIYGNIINGPANTEISDN